MDVTLENELMTCAHCGSVAKVLYNELGNKEYISRCTAALSCGTRGSAFLTKAESVEAWNKRARPPAQPQLSDDLLRRCEAEVKHLIHCCDKEEVPFAGDETHELLADILKARSLLSRQSGNKKGGDE